MFDLRDYQKTFVGQIVEAFNTHNSVLGISATGSGKTVMAGAIISEMLASSLDAGTPYRVLVLQHRDELVEQNLASISSMLPTDIAPSVFTAATKDPTGTVVFGMIETVRRALAAGRVDLGAFDLLVIDEAHHATARSYKEVISELRSRVPGLRVLGLTATPNRGDGVALGSVFHTVGAQLDISGLVQSGHLARPATRISNVVPLEQLRGLKLNQSKADYSELEQERLLMPRLVSICEEVAQQVIGRKSVVFCPTKATATATSVTLAEFGIASAVITADTKTEDRHRIIEEFRCGDVQALCNVSVATEGFDVPDVDAVVLMRNTKSRVTYLQMVGRGLRTAEGKHDCLILDLGLNTFEHGPVEDFVEVPGSEHSPDPLGGTSAGDYDTAKKAVALRSGVTFSVAELRAEIRRLMEERRREREAAVQTELRNKEAEERAAREWHRKPVRALLAGSFETTDPEELIHSIEGLHRSTVVVKRQPTSRLVKVTVMERGFHALWRRSPSGVGYDVVVRKTTRSFGRGYEDRVVRAFNAPSQVDLALILRVFSEYRKDEREKPISEAQRFIQRHVAWVATPTGMDLSDKRMPNLSEEASAAIRARHSGPVFAANDPFERLERLFPDPLYPAVVAALTA